MEVKFIKDLDVVWTTIYNFAEKIISTWILDQKIWKRENGKKSNKKSNFAFCQERREFFWWATCPPTIGEIRFDQRGTHVEFGWIRTPRGAMQLCPFHDTWLTRPTNLCTDPRPSKAADSNSKRRLTPGLWPATAEIYSVALTCGTYEWTLLAREQCVAGTCMAFFDPFKFCLPDFHPDFNSNNIFMWFRTSSRKINIFGHLVY